MTMPFLPTIFRDRITWLETFVECDSSIHTVPNYEKFCIFDYMRIFTSSDTSTGISQGMPKLIASSPGKKDPSLEFSSSCIVAFLLFHERNILSYFALFK